VNPALEDTASSPSKVNDVSMEEVERNAKKRLNLDGMLAPDDDNIDKDTLMITDGTEGGARGEEEVADGRELVKENKRQKSDSHNSNSYTNSVSAGSLEGCRREQ
jgi:hypothetical protein